MIERIQIVNFQRHEKLRIVLDEKITTLIGPSDVGKSAVLRAIRWVAFNRPLGDGFVRHGEKGCSVKVWVDGRKVERRKARGENVYLVDGKRLAAVGTEVPEEVRRIFNVTPDNFQGQHDPPFWFHLTAGEVAKRLNTIVDLEVIDRSASWLASALRKARSEQEVGEDRLTAAIADRASLAYVDALSSDLKNLEAANDRWWRTSRRRGRWETTLENARRACDRNERLSLALKDGLVVVKAAGEARALSGRVSALSGMIDEMQRLSERASTKVPDLTGLEQAYNEAEELRERRDELAEALERVGSSLGSSERLNEEWNEARADLDRRCEGVCPLCGGRFDDEGDCSSVQ